MFITTLSSLYAGLRVQRLEREIGVHRVAMYLNTIFIINNNPEQFVPFHFEEKVYDDERLECIPRNKILEKTLKVSGTFHGYTIKIS